MRKVDPAKTAERRRQVLDAALACFRRKGFAASSIADICAEAGMSPGHVYHYFPSKEDIVSAIAEDDRSRASEICAWLARQDDLVDALVSVTAEDADVGAFAIDGSLAFEIYAESERNPRVRAAVQRNYAEVNAALVRQIMAAQARGTIDPALDPKGAAILVTAIFDGLTIAGLSVADFDAEAVGRTIPLLLERFLRPSGAPASAKAPRRTRVRRNVAPR